MELFLMCLAVGFIAQLIDGSLGMGYGVILSLLLFSLGMPPIDVSASVHIAKLFAAGASGYSHFRFGNVDQSLVLRLAGGGILGALLGALVLTTVPSSIIKPVIAVYLAGMGFLIVYKAFHHTQPHEETHRVAPLGFVGGFCDAIGGGGWGAVVTSRLLVKGKNPRMAIGSVSLAEFFVAITIIGVLLGEIPQLLTQVQIIIGLIIGSALAAPLAAYVCGRIALRPLMLGVGSLIVVLSGSTVVTSLLTLRR